jgi:hypothetical protein
VRTHLGHRKDENQEAIHRALVEAGYAVRDIHQLGGGLPDLLVCDPVTRRVVLVECKSPSGRLTPAEARFFREWPGDVVIARSPEEAVRLVTDAL